MIHKNYSRFSYGGLKNRDDRRGRERGTVHFDEEQYNN